MILTKQVLKTVIAQIRANCPTITNTYLGVAPQESEFPFCTIYPVSINPDWTFSNLLETVRIQISVFDDQYNKNRLVTAGKCIENLFHRNQSLSLTESSDTGNAKLIRSWKNSELIRHLSEGDAGSGYFALTMDYMFQCQRAQVDDFESSSSSSIDSSSSSSSIDSSSSSSSTEGP